LNDMCLFTPNMSGTAVFETSNELQSGCIEVPAGNPRDRSVEQKFRFIFQRGVEERFEDGMESQFAKDLESLVKTIGSYSTKVLASLMEEGSTSPAVLAETMRWIGRAEELLPISSRLSLLEKALSSNFAIVRDSAALGLASMDDIAAIPSLERAISSEPMSELKADMQQVLEQLRGR